MPRIAKIRAQKPIKHCSRCGATHARVSYYCHPCSFILSDLSKVATRPVSKLIRWGLIPKAKSLDCVDCGLKAHDYDHRDYSRPLDVVPVCRGCNIRRGPAFQGLIAARKEIAA